MKDEGPYILEWLAYHRAIGFTDFLIYTNDCSDGTDLLLDRLQHNGIVTHVRNKVLKRGLYLSALKYAKDHSLYSGADWAYVCDIDEFLNTKIGNGHVEDLIAHLHHLGWKNSLRCTSISDQTCFSTDRNASQMTSCGLIIPRIFHSPSSGKQTRHSCAAFTRPPLDPLWLSQL